MTITRLFRKVDKKIMNVKIDTPFPENQVMFTIPFGSQVYGTAGPQSDRDYIKILYGEERPEVLQWQGTIDDTKVDYTYVTLHNFCTLVCNGGSIPMWEAAHYMDFNIGGHDLSNFDWYKVIKGHLGLAKRDLDYYPERIKHVCRSISFAQIMMQGILPNLQDVKFIPIIMDKQHLTWRHQIMRKELNKMYKKT